MGVKAAATAQRQRSSAPGRPPRRVGLRGAPRSLRLVGQPRPVEQDAVGAHGGATAERSTLTVAPPQTDRLASGPSLLCEDEATRRRMLDMEHLLRPARAKLFALMAVALLALGPWIGWWPIAPLAAALASFVIAERAGRASSRPEYWFMAAWAFAQAMIGMSVVLTGGPRSLFIAWLAIPAATLSARFGTRGVVAGVTWTVAIMVAVTVGVDAGAVADRPQRLLVPLTLLAGVSLLSAALMRSDVKHRAAAAIDPLTGLFNRQALTLRAAELIEQARVTDSPIAVLIGDLDHFKRVNDRHGHLVGDRVLREVANAMRASLRTFDYVYRFGGEEFVVLLPGSTQEGAVATAERLRAAVARCKPAGLAQTISFGVGCSQAHDVVLDDLLTAADRALYTAKSDGRDCVRHGVAQEAIRLTPPRSSTAARDASLGEHPVDAATPTPAATFALAQRMFLQGERVEMAILAGRAHVDEVTLREWCGEREELLGEILGLLSEKVLAQAKLSNPQHDGATRILAVYRQYLGSLVNARALQTFVQQETHVALRILTSSTGHVQPSAVRGVHELLREEQEAGSFVPHTDLLSLAYAIVRLTEGFLYHDTIVASEPQVERAARVVALLLD
jgi:diguanylate cyclase (GGDEF)-like protein